MDYLKTNHLSILIILFLVGSSLLGSAQTFGALDRTTVSNPWTFGGTVNITGVTTLTAAPVFSASTVAINSVTSDYRSISSTSATTTPCAIRNSTSATSTLMLGSFRVSSTSATATYVEFGKATTPYATTTSLGVITTVGAGAQAMLVASSTANWAADNGSNVFAPSDYLVVKVAGAAPTQLGGVCKAIFVQL